MDTTPVRTARVPSAGRRLYLLRHGEAAVVGAPGAADPRQAVLTARGTADIGGVAEPLAGCRLDLLVSSAVPLALEPAAILDERTGLRSAVDEGWYELRAGRVLAGSAEEVRRAIMDAYSEAGRPGARFLGGYLHPRSFLPFFDQRGDGEMEQRGLPFPDHLRAFR